MKYADGSEIRLRDRVRIFNNQYGSIVFSIDAGEYSKDFPEDKWKYLERGVMVKCDDGALVHITKTDHADDIVLVERSAAN